MDNENSNISISNERYEQLLDIETRVNVVVERLYHDCFLSSEDILWILGTELAIEKAIEIKNNADKRRIENENKN